MLSLQFPHSLLLFLYWAFFDPLQLDQALHQMEPSVRSKKVMVSTWQQLLLNTKLQGVLRIVLCHIFITPWLIALLVIALLKLLHVEFIWFNVVVGVGIGVVASLFGCIMIDWTGDIREIGSIVTSILIGSMVAGTLYDFAIVLYRIGDVGGVIYASTSIFILVYCLVGIWRSFRVTFYLTKAPWLHHNFNEISLPTNTIEWEDFLWVNLPQIRFHLESIFQLDRKAGLEAILYLSTSVKYKSIARSVIINLIGKDIRSVQNLDSIAFIADNLIWIPSDTKSEFKDLLLWIEQISYYVRAAIESSTLYNRQQQLRDALNTLSRLSSGLLALGDDRETIIEWGIGLEQWEHLIDQELELLNSKEFIPNVFVAGSPLATASKVFKGRNDLFKMLEQELSSSAEKRPTLLLLGARRTGKTSVIKQLPARLGPFVIPVEIDLQSVSVTENAIGLFVAIGNIIQKACVNRHVDIPALVLTELERDPYTGFQNWLTTIENYINDKWLLLALDEYESLGEMLLTNRVDERIFQLLRGLIQHHNHIALLFSGSHTLEDLPPYWSHYLVNVSILKVSALKESDARELITRPIPEFNLKYQDGTVEYILEKTACQPYLLQLTCRELVNSLNESERLFATYDDVKLAISSTLTSGTVYFQDLYYGRESDENQRIVMSSIAKAGSLSFLQLKSITGLGENTLRQSLRQLIHRDVLEQIEFDYRFQVELVKRWVKTTE